MTAPAPNPGMTLLGRCSLCGEWLESRTGHRGGNRPVRGGYRAAHRAHRRAWDLLSGDEWAARVAARDIDRAWNAHRAGVAA